MPLAREVPTRAIGDVRQNGNGCQCALAGRERRTYGTAHVQINEGAAKAQRATGRASGSAPGPSNGLRFSRRGKRLNRGAKRRAEMIYAVSSMRVLASLSALRPTQAPVFTAAFLRRPRLTESHQRAIPHAPLMTQVIAIATGPGTQDPRNTSRNAIRRPMPTDW